MKKTALRQKIIVPTHLSGGGTTYSTSVFVRSIFADRYIHISNIVQDIVQDFQILYRIVSGIIGKLVKRRISNIKDYFEFRFFQRVKEVEKRFT